LTPIQASTITYVMQILLGRPASGRNDRREIRSPPAVRKGRTGAFLAAVACAVAGALPAQAPPACRDGTTALVLSGGGAKGLAHVSVLQVLDSLGARPDLIVGTSMGALVGALWASGYSAAEVDSIARNASPGSLFAAGAPRVRRPWRPMTPLIIWEQGTQGFALQSPSLRESEANAALAALLLLGNLRAAGNFDSLPIPFRAVATDFATRRPVILGRGDLAQAVRASIAVPLVFPPEWIDGQVLTDGGLAANLPVGLARVLGATRVIVSDVTGGLLEPERLTGPLAITEQLSAFLFQQDEDSLGPGDVAIRIGVQQFAALDFRPVVLDSIREHGRRAADTVLSRAPCLPRAAARHRPLPRVVEAFAIRNGSAADQRILARVLGLAPEQALDLTALRRGLEHLADLDDFKALWLHPEGHGDSVRFNAEVRHGPRRVVGATLAYDNDLGSRLGVGWMDRRLLGTTVEASALGAFSRRRLDLVAGLRRYLGAGHPRLAPALEARVTEELIPLYSTEGIELGRPVSQEAAVFAGIEHHVARWSSLRIGLDGRVWRDVDTTRQRRTGEDGRSGGLAVRVAYEPGAAMLVVDAIWTGTFRRMGGEFAAEARSGKFTLTPRVRLGWGEGLPVQARFPLGGDEGFPGLAVLERRGDREVFGSLQASLPLKGPLSARLLLAAGRVAMGGELLGRGDWLGGARLGIGVDTPLGPARFEYGVATNGQDNLFVRVGRWF
jgi:predicted acylesterase/phospholipase RssA